MPETGQSAYVGCRNEKSLSDAGRLTDPGGRESGSGFSSKAVITLLPWTLIWKCGCSLTLYYNTMEGGGGVLGQLQFHPYFDNSLTQRRDSGLGTVHR